MFKYSNGQREILKDFESDDKYNLLDDSLEDIKNDGKTKKFLILHDLFERECDAICDYFYDRWLNQNEYIPHCIKRDVFDDYGIFSVNHLVCNISHRDEIIKCFKKVYPKKSEGEIKIIFEQRTSWNTYKRLTQQEKNEYLKERYFSLEDYENETNPEMKKLISKKISEELSDWQSTSFSKEDSDDYPFGDDYY